MPATAHDKDKNLADLRRFCQPFASQAFDDAAADTYGNLRASLSQAGRLIGPKDLLIASICLAHDLVLVTHNTDEFARVPGLVLDDWQMP